MSETMQVSESGGAKATKPEQMHRLDPQALLYVSRVAEWGGRKYDMSGDSYNYRRGFPWSSTFDAGQRHSLLHWDGQDYDPESGLLHIGHAAWHSLCQVTFALRGIGTDDRPLGFQREPVAPTVAELYAQLTKS